MEWKQFLPAGKSPVAMKTCGFAMSLVSIMAYLLLLTSVDGSMLPDPATPSNDTGPPLPPAVLPPTDYPGSVLGPAPASSNITSSDIISGKHSLAKASSSLTIANQSAETHSIKRCHFKGQCKSDSNMSFSGHDMM